MSMYLNRFNAIGRLVADPEFSKGDDPDGTTDRTWFRIAVNRPGSETADFIPGVCWGPTARAVAEYCQKGKVLILDGQIRTNNTQRKDGSWNNYFEVNCSAVHFGPDAKKNTAPIAEAPAPQTAAAVVDMQASLALLIQQAIAAQAVAAQTLPEHQSVPGDEDIPL